jgi:hypothetical protein
VKPHLGLVPPAPTRARPHTAILRTRT